MKKSRIPRLRLTKETLICLDPRYAQMVYGGVTTTSVTNCSECPGCTDGPQTTQNCPTSGLSARYCCY